MANRPKSKAHAAAAKKAAYDRAMAEQRARQISPPLNNGQTSGNSDMKSEKP